MSADVPGWESTCRFLGWDRALVESTVLSLRENPILSGLTLQVEAISTRQPNRDGPIQVKSTAGLYVSLCAVAPSVCVTHDRVFITVCGNPGFYELLAGFADALESGATARERAAAKLPEHQRPGVLAVATKMRVAAATVRERAATLPA